jgi:hypothetical protein
MELCTVATDLLATNMYCECVQSSIFTKLIIILIVGAAGDKGVPGDKGHKGDKGATGSKGADGMKGNVHLWLC